MTLVAEVGGYLGMILGLSVLDLGVLVQKLPKPKSEPAIDSSNRYRVLQLFTIFRVPYGRVYTVFTSTSTRSSSLAGDPGTRKPSLEPGAAAVCDLSAVDK